MDMERKDLRPPLARRMAEIRRERRYTQQECADALGIAQSTYAEMEYGRNRFRRRDLVTLAVLYGMTLEDAFPMYVDARRAA